MLVCLNCWEVYEYTALKDEMGYGMPCPKKGCDGAVEDIDECILPAIRLLNEKGYYTTYCCSGHYWDNEGSGYSYPYISFIPEIEVDVFKNIPDGFVIDHDASTGVVLRLYLRHQDTVKLHMEILKAAVRLIKWAKKLPALEDDFEMVEGEVVVDGQADPTV